MLYQNKCCCFCENIRNTVNKYYSTALQNDSNEFRFNQSINLSAVELDLSAQKKPAIQELTSGGTAKKNKRSPRIVCESDLKETTQYKGRRTKKQRPRITNEESESDKEN